MIPLLILKYRIVWSGLKRVQQQMSRLIVSDLFSQHILAMFLFENAH